MQCMKIKRTSSKPKHPENHETDYQICNSQAKNIITALL